MLFSVPPTNLLWRSHLEGKAWQANKLLWENHRWLTKVRGVSSWKGNDGPWKPVSLIKWKSHSITSSQLSRRIMTKLLRIGGVVISSRKRGKVIMCDKIIFVKVQSSFWYEAVLLWFGFGPPFFLPLILSSPTCIVASRQLWRQGLSKRCGEGVETFSLQEAAGNGECLSLEALAWQPHLPSRCKKTSTDGGWRRVNWQTLGGARQVYGKCWNMYDCSSWLMQHQGDKRRILWPSPWRSVSLPALPPLLCGILISSQ